MRQYIVNLAMKLQGVPYIWGGSTPAGFDCSGFVIWILQVFGVLPSGDWNAQGLSRSFVRTVAFDPGDLAFYVMDDDHISHVMMCVGSGDMVIGASGGDHTTTSIEEAQKKNAMVKIKPRTYRQDYRFTVNIEAPTP
jgi:cell wall-associated NlpC family hydrolase